jgi:acyl-CoA synthetase (AMP-forming)/AMP-acid ligase II
MVHPMDHREAPAGTAAGSAAVPAHTGWILADPVREHARARPDAPVLTFGSRTLTYAELDERASRVANALLSLGVGPGDRVAMLSKNRPEFFEVMFGCSKIGAVMAGLNWRLAPTEITAIVHDAQPTVVLVADEQRPLLSDEAAAVGSIRSVMNLDADYEGWLAAASATDPHHSVDDDAVVLLLYTSGTTGLPKGVELTNRGMSFSRQLSHDTWKFRPDSVNLVGMPMFHIGGCGYGMAAFVSGGHTVLIRDLDAATIIDAVARHRVTNAFFVPAVIQSILQAPGIEQADLSSLELLCYGASPIGEAVLRNAIAVLGCGFTQAYGMTETSGTIVELPPSDHDPDSDRAHLLRACGRAVPWVEIQIFDPEAGAPVAVGSVGEVWVRSAMNMKGYRAKPEETAKTLTAEGWLRTGDAAYMDDEGYIFLFDRYKDMIVSGAENIYPAEVENVMYAHPAIAEVAVIGVPHERWGETPKAMVVLKAGLSPEQTPSADDLLEFTRLSLARYKCPSSIEFVEALPRNASGKVLKKELRAPYWVGRERRIS